MAPKRAHEELADQPALKIGTNLKAVTPKKAKGRKSNINKPFPQGARDNNKPSQPRAKKGERR